MQVELRDFSVHLGSHDYGVEGKPHNGHLLSEPREGVEGLQLPFITFSARDKKAADQFVRSLNWLAVFYNIDAFHLASLVHAADRLTGK